MRVRGVSLQADVKDSKMRSTFLTLVLDELLLSSNRFLKGYPLEAKTAQKN